MQTIDAEFTTSSDSSVSFISKMWAHVKRHVYETPARARVGASEGYDMVRDSVAVVGDTAVAIGSMAANLLWRNAGALFAKETSFGEFLLSQGKSLLGLLWNTVKLPLMVLDVGFQTAKAVVHVPLRTAGLPFRYAHAVATAAVATAVITVAAPWALSALAGLTGPTVVTSMFGATVVAAPAWKVAVVTTATYAVKVYTVICRFARGFAAAALVLSAAFDVARLFGAATVIDDAFEGVEEFMADLADFHAQAAAEHDAHASC